MTLSDISIRQPVFITMLIAAIVVIGLVSYSRLGVDLLPDISLPIIAVTTVYPGAGPEEMETQVTKPIEEAVSSLAGVDKVRSTSSEGVSVVIVQFGLEIEPAQAATDVRDKISGARGKLPRDINEPVIDKFDPSAAPIVSFGVAGINEGYPLEALRSLVDERIKPTLERIDGVASVEVLGGLEREIHVDVDFGKLMSRNVSIAQLTQALRAENVTMPAGRLSEGRHELLVRTRGEFIDVGEIGHVVVASPGGVPVYLNEVASVTDGFKERRSLSRVNGKECVLFSVRKQSGTNTVSVAEGVQREVSVLRAALPDLEIRLASDESEFIRDARNDVVFSLVLGSLFAGIVVLLSFGDLRNTIVTVAGLPVCIIGAFAVMALLGFTVNVITLLALSLSVGLLIDDAIVVRENIFRHMEELGKDPLRAAREGTSEVALAVTATTLTVVAVFLPVAFATGIAGRFFRQFGITVTAAVFISLFEAFTFAPVLSAYFFKKGTRDVTSRIGWFLARITGSYDRLNDLYRVLLAWTLGHRKTVLALATLLFIGSLSLIGVVGTGGDPRGERPEFNVVLEYAPGVNLGEADALTRRFERALAGFPQVADLFTVVGSGDGAADQAVIHVRVRPELVRARAFQDSVRPALEAIPGARITFQEASSFSGAASAALTQLPVQINVRGDDLASITAAAEALKNRLSTVGGLVDVSTSQRPPRPEVQIAVDRDGASQLGMSTSQIAVAFRTFIGGDVPTKFRQGEKEVDIRVRLTEENRRRFDRLKDLYVPTPRGDLISFSQVATLKVVNGPTQITRENRTRQIVVAGNISRARVLGDVSRDVERILAGMTFPPNVSVTIGGQASQMAESFASLAVSLVLAILFVYMVLASQFGSFVQPFTIMLALPLAVIGAFVALLLAKKPFDIMAFIGLIMLMGLVTKNSILLIDYVNRGRREGMARYDAIIAAGTKRLRPILMTSFAMILGMIPVAFAFGTSADFRVSMGWTIIGGLVSSTLLTLVVVPVVYTLLDDLSRRKA